MSSSVVAGVLAGAALLLWWWPGRLPSHLAVRHEQEDAAAPRRGGAVGLVGRWRRGRRPGADEELQALALAESLAAALASGLEVSAAHAVVVESAPGGSEVGELLRLRDGESASAAWRRVGERIPAAQAVGRAIAVSERLGSPAREAVAVAVVSGRERFEQEGAVSGVVAGARATARMLVALPLAGPLAVAALGLDPVATYLSLPGVASALAGIGLTLLGHRWVARQVRRATREEVVT